MARQAMSWRKRPMVWTQWPDHDSVGGYKHRRLSICDYDTFDSDGRKHLDTLVDITFQSGGDDDFMNGRWYGGHLEHVGLGQVADVAKVIAKVLRQQEKLCSHMKDEYEAFAVALKAAGIPRAYRYNDSPSYISYIES